MPGKIEKPSRLQFFIARNADGSVLHHGRTQPDQVTETGQPTLEVYDDEASFLAALGTFADQFPPLPAAGELLSEGERYSHGGSVVEVRQSHIRTADDPDTVPALFLTVNFGGEWIVGERVALGVRRTFAGAIYQCLQAHVTQSDWTPPVVPALWEPKLQFARPASDVAAGGWGTAPLWSKVDEGENAPDGVRITSNDNTSPDNADFTLTPVTDPGSSFGHVLRARWNKSETGGHVVNGVLELWQGAPGTGTLIASLTASDISATEQTSAYTLTEAEADSITDYAALHLRLSRQGDTGGGPPGRRSLVVEFIELELST